MFSRCLFLAILLVSTSISITSAQQAPPRTAAPPSRPQAPAERPADELRGRVVDAASGHAIEYASIVLYRVSDSSMVQGTVSDASGRFLLSDLDEGRYYIEVRFMGYETKLLDDVRLRDDDLDLGSITLDVTSIALEEVEVAADRAPVSYEIDKKVIHVDGQLTATSGTAVDVLQNVPSVTVDLDGGVRLRGSGSFTLLIDGRPSALDASDALEQMPASSIENIEIITNPSARYDPEGVSGIINIIMKKGQRQGTTGTFNLNVGTQDRYGGDFLLTERGDGYAVFFGADYGKRGMKETERAHSIFRGSDGEIEITSDGTSDRAREGYSLRGGLELPLSLRDNFGLNLRYGDREHGGGSTMDYTEQREGMLPLSYISRNFSGRGGSFFAGDADYRHRFEDEKLELSAQLSYRRRSGEEESTDELLSLNRTRILSGRRSTEDGPGERLETRIDYKRPLGDFSSLEAGYQANFSSADDITSLSEYDSTAQSYVLLPEFNRSTNYTRDIHALYSLYRTEVGNFGFQAGLRGEYTGRKVDVSDTSAVFEIDRWDYFPTVHTSYTISATQQIMASYSRRIERPRGWYLEPFFTWMDAYNVRIGNPDLQPEYIDSWEVGYQTHLGDNLVSLEGYHRATGNKIERVRSVYRDNITLHRVDNVGTESASGVELMFNLRAFGLWDIYLLGNLYDYRIEGALNGQSFDEQRFTWNTRFNNTFRLATGTMLQFNVSYNSPSVSAQGRTEGYVVADLAARQEFWGRRFSATLDVSDLFHTAEREYTSSGLDFSSYQYSLHDGPRVTLTLRYNLNPSAFGLARVARPSASRG
jgi:outer membrane receptor protein involved in Fe transport